MRCTLRIAAVLLGVMLSGCVMFEVGVTNPVAGLTTVAVAPFFNLSEEPTVDGRRFAQAYYTALQKTPGFQVVPVGVVEQAIHDHRLEFNSPEGAAKLAKILRVDAVVIGAVTDYSPYYPPRIGLQVSWYSPYPWSFVPGVPVDEHAREMALPRKMRLQKSKSCESCPHPAGETCPAPQPILRGQSAELEAPESSSSFWSRMAFWRNTSATVTPEDSSTITPATITPAAIIPTGASPNINPTLTPLLMTPPLEPHDPSLPLMSYTRMFDGADPQLTARLRDYVELSGDLRSGGWEAYLYRSEDFIRFTSHLMVVEMLQLHGGEAKRRVVLKVRKQR